MVARVASEEPVAIGRAAFWCFALALAVYAFTAGGSLTTTDAVVTFDVTDSIVRRGTVAMSADLLGREAERGRDGRYYSPFGIGQSLFNIPFYLAGRSLSAWTGFTGGKSDTVPKAAVALSQTLVGALIAWQTLRLAALLTGDLVASTLAALTLAFGSILWPYARFGFNQPLASATLLSAVTCAYVGARRSSLRSSAWAGAWLALSLLTRHEMVVAAPLIGAWLALSGDGPVRERLGRLLAFVSTVALGVAVWLAYNAWRFGNPLDPGLLRDATPELGSPILSGLAGLLFSPGASLLLYSPFAVLGLVGLVALYRTDRAASMLLLSIVAVFLGFYATLGNWLGGRSYGSRYLVVVLPFLAAGWASWLARWSGRKRLVAAVVVGLVGVVVQIPGVLVDYAKVSQSVAEEAGAFTTADRQWRWQASSIVLNSRALLTAVPANARYVVFGDEPPAVAPAAGASDQGFSQQLSFSLDFWWLYLHYMRVLSRAAVLVIVLGFSGAIALAARGLLRALAAVPRREPAGA